MEALKQERLQDEFAKEEWIDGVFFMTPAASPDHNDVLNELQAIIYSYLRGKKCKLYRENIDLILADPNLISAKQVSKAEKENKVRPDLLVFCDQEYVRSGNNIIGIPDFIIEVLSPGSNKLDKVVKKEKYLKAGVKEYWIVDYLEREVLKYYQGQLEQFTFNHTVKIDTLQDLAIDFKEIEDLFFSFS